MSRLSQLRSWYNGRFWGLMFILLLLPLLIPAGCQTIPLSGRKQVLLLAESQENALGARAYREILEQEPLSTNERSIEIVNRVGHAIAMVSGRPDLHWEFHVIASDQMNAFCLPGGKVAIYEGMLSLCENEAGLAVVMSHEIAHALARHGGERMSHQLIAEGVGTALDIATREQEEQARRHLMEAYGAASQYGFILPYSRRHESEADSMGLVLMAKAGYDPSAAPRFWERFATLQNGANVPEFLSTHPSDQRRSADLRKQLPAAMKHYEASPVKYGLGEAIVSAAPGQPRGIEQRAASREETPVLAENPFLEND